MGQKSKAVPQYMQYLRQLSDFETLTDEEANLLMNNMSIKSFQKGQVLFDETDQRTRFYFLIEGVIRVERFDIDGDFGFFSYIKNDLGFPYRGLLSDKNYPYLARAMTDIQIVYFPMALVERILKQNILMATRAITEMSTILSATENQVQRMVTSSAHNRIVQAINILAEQLGADFTQKHVIIPYRVTIKELALVSGTTRETTGQVIKCLAKHDELIFERQQLTLLEGWFADQSFDRQERIFKL